VSVSERGKLFSDCSLLFNIDSVMGGRLDEDDDKKRWEFFKIVEIVRY
jgi:hypothetical protein